MDTMSEGEKLDKTIITCVSQTPPSLESHVTLGRQRQRLRDILTVFLWVHKTLILATDSLSLDRRSKIFKGLKVLHFLFQVTGIVGSTLIQRV